MGLATSWEEEAFGDDDDVQVDEGFTGRRYSCADVLGLSFYHDEPSNLGWLTNYIIHFWVFRPIVRFVSRRKFVNPKEKGLRIL